MTGDVVGPERKFVIKVGYGSANDKELNEWFVEAANASWIKDNQISGYKEMLFIHPKKRIAVYEKAFEDDPYHDRPGGTLAARGVEHQAFFDDFVGPNRVDCGRKMKKSSEIQTHQDR